MNYMRTICCVSLVGVLICMILFAGNSNERKLLCISSEPADCLAFDMRYKGYAKDDFEKFHLGLDDDGVVKYIKQQRKLDMVFPFLYFICGLSYLILIKRRSMYNHILFKTVVLLLAAGSISDLIENMRVIKCLKEVDSVSSSFASMTSYYTQAKFILLSLAVVLILLMRITKAHR